MWHMGEIMTWHRSGYRLITWLLVYLILAGGIWPALYESQLPHDHFFVGGPPPADWENHPHNSPLFLTFGPPGGSWALSDDAPVSAEHPVAAGRVVSVKPGVVLSIFTVTVLAAVLGMPPVPPLSLRLAFPRQRWPLVLTDGPATAPPRPT
jgi:hypothetical protein